MQKYRTVITKTAIPFGWEAGLIYDAALRRYITRNGLNISTALVPTSDLCGAARKAEHGTRELNSFT